MRKWSYSVNPFINATATSQRSMKKISNFTINALLAQPNDVFLTTRKAVLSPHVDNYNVSFNTWFKNQAFQLGQSTNLTDLLMTLRSEKIREWDVSIQSVYKEKTPDYITLLPHRRVPFQNGSQLDIMGAVSTLALSINTDPKLTNLKVEVDAYDLLLKNAFQVQKSSIAGTGNESDNLEENRLTVSEELYSLLGLAMDYYKKTPDKVASLFDLETIRNHQQSVFKSKIAAGETLLGMTHTFAEDEEMIFINRGKTILLVELVPTADAPPAIKNISIAANSKMIIKLQDLADITLNRFLKVINTSDSMDGAYTIELL